MSANRIFCLLCVKRKTLQYLLDKNPDKILKEGIIVANTHKRAEKPNVNRWRSFAAVRGVNFILPKLVRNTDN